MRALNRVVLVFVLALGLPAVARAQASIAGTVKDTSGAVLPGVTVEAASPALTEKTRTAVTDSTGTYRIVDLRPGTYTVSFSLTGFATVKREDIQLTGSFTAAVNIEMKVGGVAETITVSGESPIVDVQSAVEQRVMTKEVVDAIPVGRSHQSLAILIPGLSTSTGINAQTQDVGGTNNIRLANSFTIHGGRTSDSNIMQDGMQVRNIGSFANLTNMFPDMGATQEMTIDYAAGSAETATAGVRINYVPREGGNTYKFSFFGTKVTPGFQGDNYTQDLKSRGLTSPNKLKEAYDFNGSGGGPIVKDKLWFFASVRRQLNQTLIAGMYYNLNAGDASKWAYAPDLANQAYFSTLQPGLNLRGTWQESPRNKFSLSYDVQPRDVFGDRATTSPEAANNFKFNKNQIITGSWSSPVTSRLLLDARLTTHGEDLYNAVYPEDPNDIYRKLIAVTEQGGSIPGLLYRGAGQAAGPTFIFAAMSAPNIWQFKTSATYVTGSHALKVGFEDSWSRQYLLERDIDSSTSYRFNNGVPNQITERASPVSRYDDLKAELGMFVQDKWTLNKLTLTRRSPVRLLQHLLPRDAARPGPARADPQLHGPRIQVGQLEGPLAARGGRVRPVRQRQDRGQGEPRPVRAGRRSDRRQRVLDPREHRDAFVGRPGRPRHQRRLRAAVRSAEPARQRRVRRDFRLPLRHAGAEHGVRPDRPERLGQARLQLGVLGRRPARAEQPRSASTSATSAASTATSLVTDNLAVAADGLRPFSHSRAGRPEAARRRRLHGRAGVRPEPEQGRPGEQLRQRSPTTTASRSSTGTASTSR